jgi:RNA polymerase sigma factor (TIGR02999 family)
MAALTSSAIERSSDITIALNATDDIRPTLADKDKPSAADCLYSSRMSEATRLIEAMNQGDSHAAAELLPLVYQELRSLARSQMVQERAGHTLQATALVHEAYLRLIDNSARGWDGRNHFFAAAAEAMRRILIEHARSKNSLKRGGSRDRVALEDQDGLPAISSPCDEIPDLLALDEALERLATEDEPKAQLVKLLFFAGLSLEEAAAVLELSKTTAHRQWVYARAWLLEAMERGGV